MADLAHAVETLKPLLDEYSIQLRQNEDRIRRHGTISSEICAKCSFRNIENVEKLDPASDRDPQALLEWLRDNEIRDIMSTGEVLAFRSSMKEVEGVKGNIPMLEMGLALAPNTEKVLYDYRISASKLKKKQFTKLLERPFSEIHTCQHVSGLSGKNYLAYVTKASSTRLYERHQRVEELWEKDNLTLRYTVLCKECFDRIDSLGCEESIRKEGFTFVHRCPTRKVIFQNLLDKHGVRYFSGEHERLYEGRELTVFLQDLGVLALDSFKDTAPAIEKLKPDTLLAFGAGHTLPRFLQFGTNVILFDPEAEKGPLLVFDKDAQVQKSEAVIINSILEKLDDYSSQIRGKEHDKLVGAFERIGKELGFITQTEMAQKGARVDIVWLGERGSVEVAIEVETSAGWKKDIVTTWETSPKLAVVLAHFKTEKAVEGIVQYDLLRYMPHKLLFIGYLQKKAYLIEKGEIIKTYDTKSAE